MAAVAALFSKTQFLDQNSLKMKRKPPKNRRLIPFPLPGDKFVFLLLFFLYLVCRIQLHTCTRKQRNREQRRREKYLQASCQNVHTSRSIDAQRGARINIFVQVELIHTCRVDWRESERWLSYHPKAPVFNESNTNQLSFKLDRRQKARCLWVSVPCERGRTEPSKIQKHWRLQSSFFCTKINEFPEISQVEMT